MNDRDIFIRQIVSRSAEHRKAFGILYSAQLYGVCVSTLRQELDSMVRVLYLLSVPLDRRLKLIESTVRGDKWSRENSKGPITDREMVDLAQHLHGWTKSVYLFGCAFIHLSAMHDYNDRDPFELLGVSERAAIINHCRHYHGGPSNDEPTLRDLLPFLPAVMTKVSDNLECYLEMLENDEVPNSWSF